MTGMRPAISLAASPSPAYTPQPGRGFTEKLHRSVYCPGQFIAPLKLKTRATINDRIDLNAAAVLQRDLS